MVDTLPSALRTDMAGDLQRWREFYLLISLELRSLEHFVSMAAQTICAVLDAEACVVVHVTASGERIEGRQGKPPAELSAGALRAERRLMQGQLTPMSQAVGGRTCVSVPISTGSACIGVIQVIAPHAPYELSDLQFAAVLLGNTLRRQFVADQAANTERRRLEQGLAAQYAITSVLAESSTLEDALPGLLRAIGERFRWDFGVAWLLDQDKEVLRCGELWHSTAIDISSFFDACITTSFKPGDGLPGRVWAAGAPVSVPNLQRDPSFPRVLVAAGLNGALGIPILNGSEVVGVLEYFSRGVLQPDADVLQSLSTISSQIGQFIGRKRVEEVQLALEARYRVVVDSAFDAIIMISPQGMIQSFNGGAQRIFGYAAHEAIGKPVDMLLPAARQQRYMQELWRFAHDEPSMLERHNIEMVGRRSDGETVPLEVTVAKIITDQGIVMFTATLRDVTERKQAEAEHARLLSELRTERDRLVKREVEVRAQIGRDLHDGPVQQVAVATVATQHARRMAQREPARLDETLNDLEEQLKRVTHDLRNVLYELRPLGITEDGLEGVLRQYVERFRDPSGLQIHLDAPAGLRRLDVDRESAAFIIVQEAVNNARKHAQARDIWITVREQADALSVEVRDNGRGFDLEATQANYIKRGSFGLLNMRERAQLIGGTCDMWSAPGYGTRTTVHVPF